MGVSCLASILSYSFVFHIFYRSRIEQRFHSFSRLGVRDDMRGGGLSLNTVILGLVPGILSIKPMPFSAGMTIRNFFIHLDLSIHTSYSSTIGQIGGNDLSVRPHTEILVFEADFQRLRFPSHDWHKFYED